MKKKSLILMVVVILTALLLSGCAPGHNKYEVHPANFLSGIWHGWIAPFTLIISLFNSKVHMYEVYNTGWWYNFGFYIAIIGGFGSIAFFRNKRHRD